MGSNQSTSEDDSPIDELEDLEEELQDEGEEEEEDDEGVEEEDDEESLKEGFHMIFSPELVRRLQGVEEEEAEEEQWFAEEEEKEESPAEAERRRVEALVELSRAEARAVQEIEQALGSLPASEVSEPESAGGVCEVEQEHLLSCLKSAASPLECRDLVEQYNKCATASVSRP